MNTTLDMYFHDVATDHNLQSMTTEFGITQIGYSLDEEGYPLINLYCRDRTGEFRQIDVTGFQPYFYIAASPEEISELIEDPRVVDIVEDDYRTINDIKVYKVITKKPSDVKELREGYKHFEADILFTTRFLIDTGIKSGVKAPDKDMVHVNDLEPVEIDYPCRISVIDIECDDRNGFPQPERDPVICITAWDSFDDEYTTFIWPYKQKSEEQMFEAFLAYIQAKDPDILTGWNFTNFDAPYIIDRLKALGIDPSPLSREGVVKTRSGQFSPAMIKGRVLFDLLYGYKKMQPTQKESYRLDWIAENELGEQKHHFAGSLGDLWEKNPEELIKYNRKDVELCVKIDQKNDIIGFSKEVANFVGCTIEDTLNSSRVIDTYVLRKSYRRFVLPSKQGEFKGEFEGAVVLSPIRGVRENVIVLDLASLYPMSMMTLNASPETKAPDGEIVAPNGIRFRKSPDGLTRSILKELIESRDEKKAIRDRYPFGSDEYRRYDLQQAAIKVITNSYYGVSGYPRFRLYDRDIASATTSVGRAIIQHTKSVIEGLGYEVVYGDTDSCMVTIGPGKSLDETIETGQMIEKRVNESYDEFAKTLNVDHHYFRIKFEKVYSRFFQAGRKKRYAGKLVWKEGKFTDQLDITGFEFKRSDFPTITKEVQKEVIKRILDGEDFNEIGEYLRGVISKFEKGELSLDDIGIPGGIQKRLYSYANDDAHIRGAKYANTHFGTNFGRGGKPKRIYIARVPEGYPRTDVICFEYEDQVPDGFVPDWKMMLEKTIKNPIERILEAMGWSWTEIKSGKKQIGLDGFF
ncbi:MAG: DNA polymerase elongation subunit (family b) [Candidatus Syntrophoarchaeum caldarius]|uniref:DNA polymerase n=1 Tax=Candidatus Syntropharchaeum caldarium TaxID=1838285 RepID=A0A1F2P941_9EURY|nr:MAG: DNA polymerase elongation subunit (family b) [Candidatus Syntrophoarchaeum caldarius]